MTPGIYNIGDAVITLPVTGSVITDGTSAAGEDQNFIDRLDGMSAVTLFMRFAYGAGGTNVKVYVQTSIDQGTTWIDIASALFTTSSETLLYNLSGLTPKTTQVAATDGMLTDDSSVDGILGDRLRVKITTTGTYSGNTTLSVRAALR